MFLTTRGQNHIPMDPKTSIQTIPTIGLTTTSTMLKAPEVILNNILNRIKDKMSSTKAAVMMHWPKSFCSNAVCECIFHAQIQNDHKSQACNQWKKSANDCNHRCQRPHVFCLLEVEMHAALEDHHAHAGVANQCEEVRLNAAQVRNLLITFGKNACHHLLEGITIDLLRHCKSAIFAHPRSCAAGAAHAAVICVTGSRTMTTMIISDTLVICSFKRNCFIMTTIMTIMFITVMQHVCQVMVMVTERCKRLGSVAVVLEHVFLHTEDHPLLVLTFCVGWRHQALWEQSW